jgi:hypothetical protein
VSDEILAKITKIIEKTSAGELGWVQENQRTYYTSEPNAQSELIQLSIQFIPEPKGLMALMRSPDGEQTKNKYVFKITNITSSDIIYVMESKQYEYGYNTLDSLYKNVVHHMVAKASKALDEFLD